MNKKYIKPSIVVEKALLTALMETASVLGEISKDEKGNFTINSKEGNLWFDEDDDEE
jgi:hypothetical protein